MTWLESFWHELARVFPIILTVEVGRYIVTAGLVSLIIGVFWNAYFKARKIQRRWLARTMPTRPVPLRD